MASDEALRDRSGIPLRGLTNDEIREFLAHPWTCRLATVQPNGAPYVVPLWYEYDPDEGCLYIVARERSAYVEHIKHEPRVSVSIADDSAGNRRVQFEGRAEIVEGPTTEGQWVPMGRRMAARYLGAEDGPRYLIPTLDRPRYLIRIRPYKMQSWQGGEWHPRYR